MQNYCCKYHIHALIVEPEGKAAKTTVQQYEEKFNLLPKLPVLAQVGDKAGYKHTDLSHLRNQLSMSKIRSFAPSPIQYMHMQSK